MDSMTLMRIRDVTSCPQHRRAIIALEDVSLTFYADPDDVRRLARELAGGPRVCHPVFDFIQSLLQAFHATPTRVAP